MSYYLEKTRAWEISLKNLSFFKLQKGYKQLKYPDLANFSIFLNKNLQKIIKHRKIEIASFD